MVQVNLICTDDLPSYAVCYVEYGNEDGMSEEDIKLCDEWLASLSEGGQLHFEYGEESYFTKSPAFGLACDCVEVKVYQVSA